MVPTIVVAAGKIIDEQCHDRIRCDKTDEKREQDGAGSSAGKEGPGAACFVRADGSILAPLVQKFFAQCFCGFPC